MTAIIAILVIFFLYQLTNIDALRFAYKEHGIVGLLRMLIAVTLHKFTGFLS